MVLSVGELMAIGSGVCWVVAMILLGVEDYRQAKRAKRERGTR